MPVHERPRHTSWADVLVAAVFVAGAVPGGSALASRVDLPWADGRPVQADQAARERLAAAKQRDEILRQTRTKVITQVAEARRDLLVDRSRLTRATGEAADKLRVSLDDRTELVEALEFDLRQSVGDELKVTTELAAATEKEQKSRTEAESSDRRAKAIDRALWIIAVWAVLIIAYLTGRRRARRSPSLHPRTVTALSALGITAVAAVPLIGWMPVAGTAVAVTLLLILRAGEETTSQVRRAEPGEDVTSQVRT
ncbi:hypothetical protein JIG36_07475 [Actinoplanes sp. LDG1-06]|uniref:Uncharacterized protein n=1 Tax=Paractinoplanes ovalisporus TaxID=2810368 RepID=A0ABS2A6C8_9ACTN|nr:hypothetical protein [Actinoplanes ovalisporus]MBM2615403.1 hypothetical protein [Actinoplanes ovalisporus]